MGFAINSEWALWLAWRCGVATLVLTGLLMLQIVGLRVWQAIQQRRSARFRAEWEPVLMQSLEALPAAVPPIRRSDRLAFLALWNYLHDSLRDEAKEQLNQVARLAGADVFARRMIRRGSLRKRLLGMTTVGQLRDDTAWDALLAATSDPDPLVSLIAAKALLRIDAPRAAGPVIQQIAARADWSLAACAGLLKEASADVISAPLINAALQARPTPAARLIRLFVTAHASLAVLAARQLLAETRETEVLTGCLRLLNDQEDLAGIRRCLKDARGPVRVQAAAALGRLGTAEDETYLLDALWDAEWWVRYRAAQALVSLPGISPAKLKQLPTTRISDFGRDILNQALAERRL